MKLINDGFEKYTGSLPTGFATQGERATLDTTVFHTGLEKLDTRSEERCRKST
jgi:hypothetical protein